VRFTASSLLALSVALASGCEGNTGSQIEPLITVDTIEVAAPGSAADLPSAVDVTARGGVLSGGRHPERLADAEQWDFAIRVRDGAVLFVPPAALGAESNVQSMAGITAPVAGRSFDQVIEAPGAGAFRTDSAVVAESGSVYVVRSRPVSCGFGSASQYAKIQPLEISVAEGRVSLLVSTNEVCGDPRLVEKD
jgi:hypothetical protein